MIYYNKINLPENLSSLHDINNGNSHHVNELISYLFTVKKLNAKQVKTLFLNFFENKIHTSIRKNYTTLIGKILDNLLPIMLKHPHPKQGTYQLLRFLDQLSPNFEFLEEILSKKYIHSNLCNVLEFSGHITNIISKDPYLLETLDPYFSLKLNENINVYNNAFDKIDYTNFEEEKILNVLRITHRKLKLKIILSIINNSIELKPASLEFSLLAKSCLKKTIEIAYYLINSKTKSRKVQSLEIGIISYGKFAQNTMTSNSDLDLVFIFPDKVINSNQNYKNLYIPFSKKIINILSSKTSEGILYEVDTKLKPTGKVGPVACDISEFCQFHKFKSFCWETIALKKAKLVFESSKFHEEIKNNLENLKLKKIKIKNLVDEIKIMRGIKINKNKVKIKMNKINWYETKYSLGGQRDIEFLNFFYEEKEIIEFIKDIDEKKIIIKRIENFYFIVDQYVNITYLNQKPEKLPNKILKNILKKLNIKNLSQLKTQIKSHKNKINEYLNEILHNY